MLNVLDSQIYIGQDDDSKKLKYDKNWGIIHATRTDFEERIKNPYLPPINIENSLRFFEIGNNFYLNWIDVTNPDNYQLADFQKAFDFIDNNINSGRNILIQCDFEQARSQTLAMFYLAKKTEFLPDNYFTAVMEFANIFTEFDSESGICKFVADYWNLI